MDTPYMQRLIDAIIDEVEDIKDLVVSKQRRYGRNLPRHGLEGIVIRLSDKTMRLENLVLGNARASSDESVIDTLRDQAGYCIMALALHRIGDLTKSGDWDSQEPQEPPDRRKEDLELWLELVAQSQRRSARHASASASSRITWSSSSAPPSQKSSRLRRHRKRS